MAYDQPIGTLVAEEFARGHQGSSVSERFAAALSRIRYQLLGGIFLATLVPELLRDFVMASYQASFLTDSSVYGCLIAFLIGFLIFRKLTAFPGVAALAYVVPSFMASYSLVVLSFFMLRLDYSRFQFASSFVLTSAFFLLVFLLARRGLSVQLDVVPGGRVAHLLQIPLARWRTLTHPDQVAESSTPLVVDLRANLSSEWEGQVTQAALNGRPIYHVKQVEESLSGQVQVDHLSENPFGVLGPSHLYGASKRYIDLVLAAAALLVLSPILIVLGIGIRMESAGPAIFRQQRVGQGGKSFTIFKFRSMRELTAAEQADPNSDVRHDVNRITRIGQFIRRTRLDELPQLVNILRGEMSWIGPRPETMKLSQMYQSALPFYRYRHIVRPGITGWAQVNQGHVVGVDDASEKLQYDFFYVKHFSVWLDLLVVLRTVRVVVLGSGAK